jgi:hypothetical protein
VSVTFPVRSLRERAERYRYQARKAEAAASCMTSQVLRAGWLKIARDWNALAMEIEEGHGFDASSGAHALAANQNAKAVGSSALND